MKLEAYLSQNNLTAASFARELGVTRSTVFRFLKGHRRPSWPLLERIVEKTAGAVQPADFFAPGDCCLTGNAAQPLPKEAA